MLDEPSSGIAQRETEQLAQLLQQLKHRLDVTLVVIEHDIPLIMSLADRIVAMEAGRVIAEGEPEQVRTDPRVVESYLGGDLDAIYRSGERGSIEAATTVDGSALSLLAGIKGIGPARREALLSAFGTVEALQAASVDQLRPIPGIGANVAQVIHRELRRTGGSPKEAG